MGVATAILTATSVGVATVETAGTIYCAPGKVCPDLAILWTLRVIVTKSATAALTLRLTSVDVDNTYRVRPGDRLIVTLDAAPKYTWSEPIVTTSTVVRRIAGRAGATANGLFVARSSGRTVVVATQEPNCGHCSLKRHRFSVNVVVTSRS
jgi:protein involved in polysaccharide export with SLBB domain